MVFGGLSLHSRSVSESDVTSEKKMMTGPSNKYHGVYLWNNKEQCG
jgi:hypothetical protein